MTTSISEPLLHTPLDAAIAGRWSSLKQLGFSGEDVAQLHSEGFRQNQQLPIRHAANLPLDLGDAVFADAPSEQFATATISTSSRNPGQRPFDFRGIQFLQRNFQDSRKHGKLAVLDTADLEFNPRDNITRYVPSRELALRGQLRLGPSDLISETADLRAANVQPFSVRVKNHT